MLTTQSSLLVACTLSRRLVVTYFCSPILAISNIRSNCLLRLLYDCPHITVDKCNIRYKCIVCKILNLALHTRKLTLLVSQALAVTT